jgi:single-stranded DNA-binding protein
MRTQGENIQRDEWMDEYQESNKEKREIKAHTQGENIQGMNGRMNTNKQKKKKGKNTHSR